MNKTDIIMWQDYYFSMLSSKWPLNMFVLWRADYGKGFLSQQIWSILAIQLIQKKMVLLHLVVELYWYQQHFKLQSFIHPKVVKKKKSTALK